MHISKLFTPSRVKDASSLNKMTLNSSEWAFIQRHKSIHWAWSPGSRCCTFDHGEDTDLPQVKFATAAYVIRRCERPFYEWKTRTYLKNVLSCVNRSYQIPFRLQRNTWKKTSITQCLVNSRKYTSRRNSSIGKTPLVFLKSSMCIAIAKKHTQNSCHNIPCAKTQKAI